MFWYVFAFAVSPHDLIKSHLRRTDDHQALMVLRRGEWAPRVFDGKNDPGILQQARAVCQQIQDVLSKANILPLDIGNFVFICFILFYNFLNLFTIFGDYLHL